MYVESLDEALEHFDISKYDSPFIIPTETVYGIAARIDREEALRQIFAIKGRPSDNPLIVHISSLSMLRKIIKGNIPHQYQTLIHKFWPGPLTLIFECSDSLSPVIRGNALGTVAVRMPSCPKLRDLIDKIGEPLAAPSANTSGSPSPTTVQHVIDDFGDRVAHYIDGGPCQIGLESTVFGIINGEPLLLRPGGITREAIENALGYKIKVQSKTQAGEKIICPGQKYRHYSPSATVYLFKGPNWQSTMAKYAGEFNGKSLGVLGRRNDEYPFKYSHYFELGSDTKECCKNLFAGLRELDKSCDVIFIKTLSLDHEGLAIMDRLEKASTHIVE